MSHPRCTPRRDRGRRPAAALLLGLGLVAAMGGRSPALAQVEKVEKKAEAAVPPPPPAPPAPVAPARVEKKAAFNLGVFQVAPAAAPVDAVQLAPAIPMAKRAAAADLIAYLQFDGLDAHAAAWQGSSTYKILNETTFGVMLEEVVAKAVDLLGTRAGRRQPVSGEAVVRELKGLGRRGFAVAINGKLPAPPRVTLTIRGGARPGPLGLLTHLAQPDGAPAWTTLTRQGRQVTLTTPPFDQLALINDKDDLIICGAKDLDAVFAVLDGKEPDASTHPLVASLGKKDGGFEPTGFAFLDVKKLPPMPPELTAAGLGAVERLDARFGFEQGANYQVFRIVAPGPRAGLLGLLDGSTLDKGQVGPLPAGSTHFALFSLATVDIYDRVIDYAKKVNPGFAEHFPEAEKNTTSMLGGSIRDALVGSIGPRVSIIATPGIPGGIPFKAVMMAEVRDAARLKGIVGKMVEMAKRAANGPGPEMGPSLTLINDAKSGLYGVEVAMPQGAIPPTFGPDPKPTLLIGAKYLAFALTRAEAEAKLSAVEKAGSTQGWKPPDAAFAQAVDRLPSKMAAVIIGDPRPILPPLVANLPGLIAGANAAFPGPRGQAFLPIELDPAKIPDASAMQARMFPVSAAIVADAAGITITSRDSLPALFTPVPASTLVALLLPAAQSSREAARRSQCVNNLKQMGLAFHNFESTNNHFPAQAIVDKDGKPLLSWRVAILPFIEQGDLYNQFKLDEPWDSPSNKPLLKKMPRTYACPTRPEGDPTLTHYRVFTGKDTPFGEAEGKPIAGFTDGTSNTLLVVEADEAVPWTKPEGIPFDFKMVQDQDNARTKPLFGAGSAHPGGFNALFADGSVRFLKKTINRVVLGALITPAGGEVINADAF